MLYIKTSILLCILLYCTCANRRNREDAIESTSYKIVPIEDWPFIASVIIYPNTWNEYIAGAGVFVSENCVVTNADVVTYSKKDGTHWHKADTSNVEVGFGSADTYNFQRRKVKAIEISNFFSYKHFKWAIAVIVLNSSVILNGQTQVASVPYRRPADNTKCQTAGWDFSMEEDDISGRFLVADTVYIMPDSDCKGYGVGIDQFCTLDAPSFNICQITSGSPLVCEDKLYGLANAVTCMFLPNYYPTTWDDFVVQQPFINETIYKYLDTHMAIIKKMRKPNKGTFISITSKYTVILSYLIVKMLNIK